MRQLLIIISFLVIACGQPGIDEELLTNNNWSISKVEYLNTGQFAPSELNKGTTWTFNSDKTEKFEIKNDFSDITFNGIWNLEGNILTIMQDKDTTNMIIEELTDTNLNWLVTEKDTIRFYLVPKK